MSPAAPEQMASPKPADPDLARALAAIVGPRWVKTRGAERRTYEADGLPTHASVPMLAVLPGSKAEVIAIVRLLHQRQRQQHR